MDGKLISEVRQALGQDNLQLTDAGIVRAIEVVRKHDAEDCEDRRIPIGEMSLRAMAKVDGVKIKGVLLHLDRGVSRAKILAALDGDEKVEQLIAENAELRERISGEREGWQPIGTTPSGEVVLLADGGSCFAGMHLQINDNIHWVHWDGDIPKVDRSQFLSVELNAWIKERGSPTHWRPLPAPPQEDEG